MRTRWPPTPPRQNATALRSFRPPATSCHRQNRPITKSLLREPRLTSLVAPPLFSLPPRPRRIVPADHRKQPRSGGFMKKLLTVLMLGLFSVSVIGCEASAEVDDEDNGRDSYSKKTTTVDDDGERTTKTEVRKTDR